jgi:alpha-tubulin suppressor-like RCC1 family protein
MKKIILLQFFLFNIILLANAQCWKSVSQGPNFVLAIKTDGTLWAWGNGYYGVLGNGTNGPLSETNTPIQVGSDADWKTVSCGNASVMALKTNGTLWGWGSNKYYQLGNPGNDVYVPTQVGSNSDWSSLSCGDLEASAIKQDGTLWTWGSDYYNTGSNSIPTKVGTDNDWKSVTSGFENTEIIKNNGTPWA